MGSGYLIDSNVIIDLLNGNFNDNAKSFLFNIQPIISVINQIEIFSKKGLSSVELGHLQSFIQQSDVLYIDQNIATICIGLRLNYKIKLLDAIIAATALAKQLTLLTHNVSDFRNIPGLKIIDPHLL